jgi:hypothetical protein
MDVILFWNDVALEANRVSHTNHKKEQAGPPLSARALAIVHLAMYDAYAAVAGDPALPPYMPGLPAPPSGATPQAAAGGAAHAALWTLFPSQTTYFNTKLSDAGGPLEPGHTFGVQVAQALLQDRKDDPGVGDTGYVPSFARGKHRVDPDNPTQGFHAPLYGAKSRGFAITSRHELIAPPFDDDEYRRALLDVRGKGIAPELMGTLPAGIPVRTPNETLTGLFWATTALQDWARRRACITRSCDG